MDQENTTSNDNTNSPPATSSDSMSPGKDSTGDGSKTGSPVGVGAADKGKGVATTEEGEESGSKGKRTADVVAADGAAKVARAGGRRGDRNVHIITERERRKRMSEMFNKLHGLLPSLPDKIDKSSIVMEAINCIKSLEVTLSELEKRKLEMELVRGRRGAADGGIPSSVAPPPAVVALPQPVLPVCGIWPTVAAPVPPAGAVTPALAPGFQTWSGPNVVLSLSGDDAYINVCVARRPGVLTMVADVLERHSIDVVTSGIASDSSRTMFTIHTRVNGASRQFGGNVPSEDIYKLAVSEILVRLSD